MRRMLAVAVVAISMGIAAGTPAQTSGVGVQAQAGGMRAQAPGQAQTAAPLESTEWMLTWVEGVKVPQGAAADASRRRAHIELDPASHRLTGTGGCNQVTGAYQLEGDRLRLTGTARTMMACANGMDVEDKLVKALDEVREWKVSGQTLELLDGSGSVVARFSAEPRADVR